MSATNVRDEAKRLILHGFKSLSLRTLESAVEEGASNVGDQPGVVYELVTHSLLCHIAQENEGIKIQSGDPGSVYSTNKDYLLRYVEDGYNLAIERTDDKKHRYATEIDGLLYANGIPVVVEVTKERRKRRGQEHVQMSLLRGFFPVEPVCMYVYFANHLKFEARKGKIYVHLPLVDTIARAMVVPEA